MPSITSLTFGQPWDGLEIGLCDHFLSLPADQLKCPLQPYPWNGWLWAFCTCSVFFLVAAMFRKGGQGCGGWPGRRRGALEGDTRAGTVLILCVSALCMGTALVDSGITSGRARKRCRPGLSSVCVKYASWAFQKVLCMDLCVNTVIWWFR